eukprot:TRINITY_DN17366_c0_g2_i1.p1 TRINITY_DN17366_c0_g2~~TRINITY_DN17366_c0_g2_i1.p1  ORF type:complete len:525 (+),score=132.25 TRINITY_DN17366_c0_g2_i1:100-1674(+)
MTLVTHNSGKEWQGEPEDSDEEEEGASKVADRRASQSYINREKRLSVGVEALKQENPIGDKEIEVVSQANEWGQADDSDDESNATNAAVSEQRASQSFQKREKRLSVAVEALKEEKPLGDTEIQVKSETKEWNGAQDSDDENDAKKFEKSASEAFRAREKRLTVAAEALKQELPMGDTEVQVVSETKEWRDVQDSDDEDASPRKSFERRSSAVASAGFQARERRLSVQAVVLQQEKLMGDQEVPVVAQATEWSAAQALDSDDEAPEVSASQSYKAREKRLTIAVEALKEEKPIGDQEVQVVSQSQEWSQADDSDEERSPKKTFERRASQCLNKMEKRISLAQEALKQDLPLGDTEVPVVVAAKEWKHAEDSDNEDSKNAEKSATASFTERERRISRASVVLQKEIPLGDADVEVVRETKEWSGVPDSDNEECPVQLAKQAVASFEKRESRLSLRSQTAEEDLDIKAVREQASRRTSSTGSAISANGSADGSRLRVSFEQEAQPARGVVDSDRCADRCTNSCTIS